jgi:hypothetical protein
MERVINEKQKNTTVRTVPKSNRKIPPVGTVSKSNRKIPHCQNNSKI